MRDPQNAHWRDSARTPQFFIMDAYATFPLLFFLMHMRLWTFIVVVITILFFAGLEKFGFTLPVFRRWLIVMIGGNLRSVRPWWKQYRRG
ncbi:MAG TPA: IcmT/TraK family protein [Gammaproteobacteria bacterium]|nr:IcmT/TraK family protein [Gammaproteobacteria bacterium]